ncbi:MAG: methionine ABC transporter ATP-binding protein [Clostridiaceae bacterium]|nr:methionine ABC transporter ATP-binding protein [Clostridiaceae bacterium]
MIYIKGLKKSFDNLNVLEGIDLKIQEGAIFGLAGRSGTGKSTLLRCINSLESFDEGILKVMDVNVDELTDKEKRLYRKNIGMIFQQFSLLNRLTVYENVALPMKCWNYKKEDIDKTVKDLLEVIGIPEKIHSKTRELSGGQKQRVAIARALSMEPKILLCDEATSALDPKSTQEVLALLKRINKDYGITVVMVTHEMAVLRSICQEIAIIEEGKVQTTGTVESIFKDKPLALRNLLGDDQKDLPSSGRNLELLFSKKNMNEPVISQMARDILVDCRIVGGELESYNNDIPGTMIINIEEEHVYKVKEYLDKRNFLWRELVFKGGEAIGC